MQDKILMMLLNHPSVVFAHTLPIQAHISGMLKSGQTFVITIGEMTPEQKAFQQKVRDNNGIAICADNPDSVDFAISQ